MTQQQDREITGATLLPKKFSTHETAGYVDVNKVFEVLHGDLAAYRIHDYAPPEVSAQIVKNFWSSKEKTPRFGDGYNGVEAYIIGASHIEKTTEEYLQAARHSQQAVHALFSGTINPIDTFRQNLVAEGTRYKRIRPAQFQGRQASDAKAVLWNSDGDFFLEPHDDFAQLKDPKQKGFEIQEASRVMAVNFYAQVPNNAGQLKLWNIEPDDHSRYKLGLTYSGYPYPKKLLDPFPSLEIPVKTGELCVINGNLIHAVLRGAAHTNEHQNRVLITIFMTFNAHDELIWWT